MTPVTIVPTLFEYEFSDAVDPEMIVSKALAEQLFLFFRSHKLFNWIDSHNGCEARADAVCVLLDEWKIPNYKGWVFSGKFLKNHVGGLKQNWNYHVAPMLPVKEAGSIIYYMLDPASANNLQRIEDWAANVTEYAHSYYMIKEPQWYIFPGKKITRRNWHLRNRQNRKWMIQGIAGINGLGAKGKAELCFNKGRIKNTFKLFEQLKKNKSFKDFTGMH